VGREVQLIPGKYRSRELDSVDDFWATHDELAELEMST
jgi:hypothetical protein